MNKYRNQKTVVDGYLFDSKKEAARYGELKLMEKAGVISDLSLQPKFEIRINGDLVCRYIADFQYVDIEASDKILDFVRVVEDVKSAATKTPVYRLKKKLMKAIYGIEIQEV